MQREFFQPLVENVLDIITVLDGDRIISYGNSSIERVLGYEPAELLGQSFLEFIHPDDVPNVVNVLNGGTQIPGCLSSFEFRFQRRDGSWCDLEALAKNLLGDSEVEGLVLSSRDITQRKRAEEELRRSFERMQRTLDGMITALAAVTEKRDPYIAGHQRRVTQLACAMAGEMGLSGEQIEGLRVAGTIHDIGKINVPGEILRKPSSLNDLELAMVETHPQAGCDLLKGMESPWPVAQILLQHHERLDGSGYPKGLAGESILLEARILAIADVVEAMSHRRSYRSALDMGEVLGDMLQNKGVLYDPQGVDACLALFTEKGFVFEEDSGYAQIH